MIGLFHFVLAILASPFKPNLRLDAENAMLRHQLMVLRRRVRGRVRLTNNDRWFFIQLYRWFPSILQVLTIIRPETLVRWHRAGFRRYWRWKSRRLGGRPQIETELRGVDPADERRKSNSGRSRQPANLAGSSVLFMTLQRALASCVFVAAPGADDGGGPLLLDRTYQT